MSIIERAVASAANRRPIRSVAGFADRVRRLRISRNDRLGTAVFRDPGWDMMLDLLVAQDEQRDLSVSQLCLGSGVPATTALRYIDRLEQLKIIERHDDCADQRRTLVKLSGDTAPKLHTIVAQLQDCA